MAKSLFDLPKKSKIENVGQKVVSRTNKSSAPAPILVKSSGTVSKKGDVLSQLNTIKSMVVKNLSKYQDRYSIIDNEDILESYIDMCISNGEIAIDTETSGLDPLTDNLAGICVYTPNEKASYIPLNHLNYITLQRVKDQIPLKTVREQFQRLVDNDVKVIMHNAKFDIRFIKNKLGVKMFCYWDTLLASVLLNENEPHGLKVLHNKYCLDGKGDAFTFDDLFENFNFQYIPVSVGYLYAARDAEITYELYKFQKPFLTEGEDECIDYGLEDVSKVFREIEMPCVDTLVEMEDIGVTFDFKKNEELQEYYNKLLDQKVENFYKICNNYSDEIEKYRRIHGANCKLEDPISISSTQQISILLYDILKLSSNIKKGNEDGKGTGESILQSIDHPITKAVLEYREVAKLLNTFIEKLPEFAQYDGRIHAQFNSTGAATGRLSSQNPNLQQIPSRGKGKVCRQMFIASPGYVLCGSDYSAQEPRICAHMCQDPKMLQAYKDGKDLYCEIASIAFDVSYEDCLEFNPDGSTNAEGKKRRSTAKAIVLGILYGKGISAIAEDLNVTKNKAQEIYNDVMLQFPALETFIEDCKSMAHNLGYVTTVCGRKRRLPNAQLPKYEVRSVGHNKNNFDPLAMDEEYDDEIDEKLLNYYIKRLDNAWGSQKQSIKDEALRDGIEIKDNGGFIAEAERQCVNSRIQGSAADMCKKAMNLIHYDKKMNEWGFRLLLPIHDELIGEAPVEHARECGIRLAELMIEAADGYDVPFKTDAVWSKEWYGKEYDADNLDELINIVKREIS